MVEIYERIVCSKGIVRAVVGVKRLDNGRYVATVGGHPMVAWGEDVEDGGTQYDTRLAALHGAEEHAKWLRAKYNEEVL